MTNSTVSYKELKEDFVSNLSGGSVSEILSVTAVAPVRLYPPCNSQQKKKCLHPASNKKFSLLRLQFYCGPSCSLGIPSSSRTHHWHLPLTCFSTLAPFSSPSLFTPGIVHS